jgi:hypothetical protein
MDESWMEARPARSQKPATTPVKKTPMTSAMEVKATILSVVRQ